MKRIINIPMIEPTVHKQRHIPVAAPDLSHIEQQYLLDAFKSSWISSAGSYVGRFERAFGVNVSQTSYAVSVNSGTSALHLALLALGVSEGDEVILPTFTMIASANAIRYCGATPVFVDAQIGTWNMDVAQIEERITKNTKAIMVVHVYGLPVDMDPVLELAKKYKLRVIEDAAEAHGAKYKGRSVGSMGDIAAFSLFANKIITTGEGGMITTNNKQLAEAVSLLRNHAFGKHRHYWHERVGYSYNMTNLSAAIGLGQVERFAYLLQKHTEHAYLYERLLTRVSGLTTQTVPAYATPAYWMFGLRVNAKIFGITRDTLRKYLADHGVETRSFFVPVHQQPAYSDMQKSRSFPVSEVLSQEGLYLPSSSLLTVQNIRYIASLITKKTANI
jgi:perosamine synthetase